MLVHCTSFSSSYSFFSLIRCNVKLYPTVQGRTSCKQRALGCIGMRNIVELRVGSIVWFTLLRNKWLADVKYS